ncbi:transposable element Tcb2 transposase [Trichonephila clavipes]|uniref:Transposable element Tcb2 transposase n=1 Tax=Trichonephila clavipes TaxID=2585209 RepID=A0A8X7BEK1_TRICX|nr:transposable element Tcb2 transposase [Trichonephila clavipes]
MLQHRSSAELQRRMRTGICQLLPKETDGARHQTCLVSYRYDSFKADRVQTLRAYWSICSFSLQSESRRTFIWRAPGTRYHQENTVERHRYGGAGGLTFRKELLLLPELTSMYRV